MTQTSLFPEQPASSKARRDFLTGMFALWIFGPGKPTVHQRQRAERLADEMIKLLDEAKATIAL